MPLCAENRSVYDTGGIFPTTVSEPLNKILQNHSVDLN